MNRFPEDIYFRKKWRPYQTRVLRELESYVGDNHLHVVAAPGSGKTVLGLEVALRLNQPTLICAPTVAICDQWVDRLLGLFCEAGAKTPVWISKDVRAPGFLTVTTYQGLFSAMRGKTEGTSKQKITCQALLKRLKEASVSTLVLDEAHHLRNSWWSCLVEVKDALSSPTVVALTATAPFDVPPHE